MGKLFAYLVSGAAYRRDSGRRTAERLNRRNQLAVGQAPGKRIRHHLGDMTLGRRESDDKATKKMLQIVYALAADDRAPSVRDFRADEVGADLRGEPTVIESLFLEPPASFEASKFIDRAPIRQSEKQRNQWFVRVEVRRRRRAEQRSESLLKCGELRVCRKTGRSKDDVIENLFVVGCVGAIQRVFALFFAAGDQRQDDGIVLLRVRSQGFGCHKRYTG